MTAVIVFFIAIVAVFIDLLALRKAHEPSRTDNRLPSKPLRRDHRAPVAGLSVLPAMSIRARLFAGAGGANAECYSVGNEERVKGRKAPDIPGLLGFWITWDKEA
jgi:hypothetical protein